MTKLTYEAQISGLEEVDSDYNSVVSRWSAESIANDADNEIKTLKGLLRDCCGMLIDMNRDAFIKEIEDTIKDD